MSTNSGPPKLPAHLLSVVAVKQTCEQKANSIDAGLDLSPMMMYKCAPSQKNETNDVLSTSFGKNIQNISKRYIRHLPSGLRNKKTLKNHGSLQLLHFPNCHREESFSTHHISAADARVAGKAPGVSDTLAHPQIYRSCEATLDIKPWKFSKKNLGKLKVLLPSHS